jgi:hypothetical protein
MFLDELDDNVDVESPVTFCWRRGIELEERLVGFAGGVGFMCDGLRGGRGGVRVEEADTLVS